MVEEIDARGGMQIDHAAGDLAAGQQYIMTLQDQSVLDYDDQDGEVLENIDLQQSFKQRIANRRKTKLSQHANSKLLPIQDGEEDDIDGWNDPEDTSVKLLDKYNDVEDLAQRKKRANRIQIGDANSSQQLAKSQDVAKAKKEEATLPKLKIGSDYYATNEEDPLLGGAVGSFRKKKGVAGNKRARMSNTLALADNDEEDIIAALEGNAEQHLATKKSRQDAISNQIEKQAIQDVQKRANFQRAFDKVKQKNKLRKEKEGNDDLFDESASLLEAPEDDDYALIEHQLEKQRQLEIQRKAKKLTGENFIASSILAKTKEATNTEDASSAQKSQQQQQQDQKQPTKEAAGDVRPNEKQVDAVEAAASTAQQEGLEISVTNEFDANLASITHRLNDTPVVESSAQMRQQQNESSGGGQFTSQMSQVGKGLTSVLNVTLPSQLIRQQKPKGLTASTAKVKEESKNMNAMVDNESSQDDDQGEDEVEDDKNVIDELIVGKGLGNALKVLRERGILGKGLIRGRNMDKSVETQLKSFDKQKEGSQVDDKVKLQYFDKRGRVLTIKEAYRQMCWKFHGMMPSHRKRDKMAQKEEIANKISQAQNSLGSLTAVGITSTQAVGGLGSLGSLIGKSKKKKEAKQSAEP